MSVVQVELQLCIFFQEIDSLNKIKKFEDGSTKNMAENSTVLQPNWKIMSEMQ